MEREKSRRERFVAFGAHFPLVCKHEPANQMSMLQAQKRNSAYPRAHCRQSHHTFALVIAV
jgi:hypothetical protein